MNILKQYNTEFFSANVIQPVKEQPSVEWKKSRISAAIWQQIVGFMLWSQVKYKEEAQLRLFYNTDTNEWQAVPYPQTPMGMTTKELEDKPELLQKLREPVKGEGWVSFGTVHHHCTSSAFQSGTDHNDEKNQPGFHITLGHLDKEELDAHCRFSHDGGFVECSLWDFVDYPVQLAQFPRLIPKWYVMPITYEFPALWTESIIEKPAWNYSPYSTNNSWTASTFKKKDFEQTPAYKQAEHYSYFDTLEFFVEDVMARFNYSGEAEIALACTETHPNYNELLKVAKDYFDEPIDALNELHNDYTDANVYNTEPMGPV